MITRYWQEVTLVELTVEHGAPMKSCIDIVNIHSECETCAVSASSEKNPQLPKGLYLI